MKTLVAYFTIKGRTEEALKFYEDCFGGQTIFVQRYSETPYQVSEAYKNKIAHAEFKAENVHFYISDGFEKEEISFGNGIGMTVNFDNPDEQKSVFEKLKIDGNVTFDFFQTTIDTNLVCVIDKFGVHWYLNYVK
ncbi:MULTISPECIES: VOC family protein [Bacteroidota]|uniref:PhnB protein n=3 Tax=Bacteroidota TaxID=976 RepID=A0A1N7QB15_9FLAO|nr:MULTISPECIES: VOC family protein [Bacteroidota]TCV15273.1 PhnB protein [Sphingobacterium alimentarium]SHK26046.1 PhnB protein [Epilithonimonas mollis]SIT20041.1 PhnB protein [Chryseobacterium ureilyticum]